jgi:MYXO-CTERM domain-containing protein
VRYSRLPVIGFPIVWLLIASTTAHGFDCIAASGGSGSCPGPRWANSGATLQLSLGTTSTVSWDENAVNSANEWNAVGTAFHYTTQIVPGGPTINPCNACGPQDYNPVFFATGVCGYGFGDIVAQTNACWNPSTNDMINAPVFVNSLVPWNAYDGPLQPPVNDIRRVLLHEFGHVLGLGHPNAANPPQNVTAIMNAGESNLYTLQADDIAGIRSLYPNSAPPGAVSGCRIAPDDAFGAWMLVLPAVLLFLRRRRRKRCSQPAEIS